MLGHYGEVDAFDVSYMQELVLYPVLGSCFFLFLYDSPSWLRLLLSVSYDLYPSDLCVSKIEPRARLLPSSCSDSLKYLCKVGLTIVFAL